MDLSPFPRWAIIEAKGGSSKRGKSTLGGTGKFKQMGREWLEYWIRKTAAANTTSDVGRAFNDAALFPGGPILTAVVSLNFKRPGKEFKIGAQAFNAPDDSAHLLNPWKGF